MTTETDLTYRAMHMLTELYAPRVKGRPPFWRPRKAPIGTVRLPAWDWTLPLAPDKEQIAPPVVAQLGQPNQLITMDINGAYLAAASSVVIGHSALVQGVPGTFRRPGYYLIDSHQWPDRRMPSPLGSQPVDGPVWVAHPTALLLDELSTGGHWPKVTVHDAWTAETSCRLRQWTDHVRDDRAEALRNRESARPEIAAEGAARYEAIKDGYAIAVQLMRGPAPGGTVKSPVLRPDWYDAIHAQHAASMWRKAWATFRCGHGPVRMGSVDEVTWTAYDLGELQMRSVPVIRIDPSGTVLGAFKIKREG